MKKRLISAIVMIAIFVPILLLGSTYYAILSSILGLVGLWELIRLEKNIPDYMKLISFFTCLYLILYNYGNQFYYDIFNYPAMVIIFLIYSLSVIIKNDLKKYTTKEAMFLFASVIIIGLLFNSFIRIRMLIILLSFGLTIVSQIGDLFFSSIKRTYNIKDYSNLIPGHGGILDRLDSVLFVILGFLLYIII
mgnify:CR=1 FL=1